MVDLKKMVLISFTINVVSFFMLFAVGIIPGLNLMGVPFIFLGIFTINLIMFFICLFKCKMPKMPKFG